MKNNLFEAFLDQIPFANYSNTIRSKKQPFNKSQWYKKNPIRKKKEKKNEN